MNNQIINNIKSLAIDMIQHAKSGHPGIVLSAAPMMYTLFSRHLNINTSDSKWFNRDRFIMSAGHGSALLYATLYMAGYNISIEDLKKFRTIHSITPGHPEYGVTPGVDMTTGPLGQGLATSVGMAIAEAKLESETRFSKQNRLEPNRSLIDHKIYVLCGDGDLMEGISYEAISLAGNLKLKNLIVLYDSNKISLDGKTNITFNEDIKSRFESSGWNYLSVKNGDDIKSIDKAIKKAKNSNKPTIIEVHTILGKGSFLENTNQVHGKLLTKEDYEQLKYNLGIPNQEFYVNEEAKNYFSKMISERSSEKYMEWSKNYQAFRNGELEHANRWNYLFQDTESISIDLPLENDIRESLRATNQKIVTKIASQLPNFIGGSADLAGPTGCYLEGFNDINSDNYQGRNIHFGVREHLMGAILNGLALYNFIPFGSTFLSFSDYLRPSIRLSCLMNLPVTYVFSHDSINIGQDGPTHQPVEQLASLRAIPNMNVYRPCDAKELIGCWQTILKLKKPSSLLLSRIDVPILSNSNITEIEKGAYIIEKEFERLDGIIIATGTDVHTAIHIARDLYKEKNISLRVVSMPCKELFLKQSEDYQEQILPKGYKKIVIESASSQGWEGMVYHSKYLCTVDKFGFSGTKDEVLKEMNFDYETLKNKINSLI